MGGLTSWAAPAGPAAGRLDGAHLIVRYQAVVSVNSNKTGWFAQAARRRDDDRLRVISGQQAQPDRWHLNYPDL